MSGVPHLTRRGHLLRMQQKSSSGLNRLLTLWHEKRDYPIDGQALKREIDDAPTMKRNFYS
jgi:hypothetical protein